MVDYSKWKDIEISDDEDDTHPNIDTPSLFRWRHQARLERMEDMHRNKEELKRKKESFQARLIDVKSRIKDNPKDEEKLKEEMEKLEMEEKSLNCEEEELKKKEKKMPWNVDTISKPGFEKTVINKDPKHNNIIPLTEEEQEKRLKKFVSENEKLCKEFGMLRKYDDSKSFLQNHPEMVCDETADYLVIWCINLEIESKHELMAHVAHQCICMQYILELAKQLNVPPRACVKSFFSKIQDCMPDYKEQFDNEIEGLKDRIKKRAKERYQEVLAEVEEEERKSRLGPGGLDPADVFEELPDELKKCFESRNIDKLQKVISEMPVEEAKYYMKLCVDSGLWVPNPEDDANDGGDASKEEDPIGDDTDSKQAASEPIYKGVSTDDLD